MSIRTFGALLYVEALRMQAAGTPVLRLNTGNPGNFGFQMPQSVRQALLENVDKAVPYCDVRGMAAARQAILEYHKSCGIQDITPGGYLYLQRCQRGSLYADVRPGGHRRRGPCSVSLLFSLEQQYLSRRRPSLSITAVTRKMPGIRIWRICAPRSPAAPRRFW